MIEESLEVRVFFLGSRVLGGMELCQEQVFWMEVGLEEDLFCSMRMLRCCQV